MGKKDTPALDIAKHPQWETHILETYPDGRIRCVPENSVWLVRELPQASVPDAESVRAGVEVGASLDRAQREIADLTQNPIRRVVSKNNYREIQIHWVNVPRKFTADPGEPHRRPSERAVRRSRDVYAQGDPRGATHPDDGCREGWRP